MWEGTPAEAVCAESRAQDCWRRDRHSRAHDVQDVQVLEDCVAKSMQAACKRLAGGLSQACSAETTAEERLMAVARGVDGLFEDITAQYTPVLVADVFNAVSLAAEQLYQMLTPQIQAWLCRGEAASCAHAWQTEQRAHDLRLL